MDTVTNKIYDGYGEMHGGSVGDDLCKPDYPCLGPDPDRVEEGNAYFDKDFPKLTKLTTATFKEAYVVVLLWKVARSLASLLPLPPHIRDNFEGLLKAKHVHQVDHGYV